MKFTREFFGARDGNAFGETFRPGDDCPAELVEAATLARAIETPDQTAARLDAEAKAKAEQEAAEAAAIAEAKAKAEADEKARSEAEAQAKAAAKAKDKVDKAGKEP